MAQSAAMELKVLINILQSGTALQSLLAQTNQLSKALTALQAQANAAGTAASAGAGVAAQTQATANAAASAAKNLGAMGTAGMQANTSMLNLEKGINKVIAAVRFLTGGFLALQGIRFLKSLADEAAHAQVLATVLHVVAQNSGITADEIDKVDKQIQRLGITAESSRQSLTQFLQAKLDLKFAPQLARAAQDLAVIAGSNSSDVFKRMIINIQQLDTLGLRWMGIIVDRKLAEDKYKQQHIEITGALQKRQMQEALMLEVLEKAKQLEGTYATAMGDVEKQIGSLARLTTTYRMLLGDSLLPAYSAIVVEITLMLEKMILLSQEFSGNTTRAQEWADQAQVVAHAFTSIILAIAEHIGLIIELAKVYVVLKAASAVVSGIGVAWGWLSRITLLMTNFGLVLDSMTRYQITAAAAAKAMAAESSIQAVRILKVAEATAPAATGLSNLAKSATLTSAALTALGQIWSGMVLTLAVPAIGYVIIDVIRKAEAQGNKPFLLQAGEARTAMQAPGPAQMGGAGAFNAFFNEWKAKNFEFNNGMKNDIELMVEFNRQIDEAQRTDVKIGITDQIKEATLAARAAQTELQNIPKGADFAGQRAAQAEVATRAGDKLRKLNEDLKAQMKLEPALGRPQMNALLERIASETVSVTRLKNTPAATADQVAAAEALLAVDKERLATQAVMFEEQMKTKAITDPTRAADVLALAKMKKALADAAQGLEDYNKARTDLFGEAVFRDEGRISAGFNKASGAFTILLNAAKTLMEAGDPIGEQLAIQLREGLEKVGKAVETGLDEADLKGLVERAQTELGGVLPEMGRLGADALQYGVLGRRRALSAIRAPIVAENKATIQADAAERIAAAQRVTDQIKAENELATADLEQRNKQQLVATREYTMERIGIIERNAAAEMAVQDQVIDRQERLLRATDAVDPNERRAAAQALQDARDARAKIQTTAGVEVMRLMLELGGRRYDLDLEIETALRAQRAEVGGLVEAVAQFNFEQDQALKKLNQYNINPDNERLFILRTISKEYEIHKKGLDDALRLEMAILQAEEDRLDVAQAQRDAQAAEDQRQVAIGGMASETARIRNNARIQDAMADNRIKRQAEINKLREQELDYERQMGLLQRTLDDERQQGISDVALRQKWVALQTELTTAMNGTKTAILGMDAAYASLAASQELHAKQIRDTIVNGFADALTQSIVDFKNAGKVWISLSQSIASEIVGIFTKAFSEALFKRMGLYQFADALMNKIFSGGGGNTNNLWGMPSLGGTYQLAEGGMVTGPGTGTSDSVPAMLSTGEHVMPAAQASRFMPLLEGIRTGRILPFAHGGVVQSIAMGHVIPRRYAGGGVVTDGGASTVSPAGGVGNMVVSLHPDSMNMTLREWLEHEVVRQQGRR